MKLPKGSPLRGFELHGVDFEGETETQHYGSCPISGKPGKFYVNSETLLWDIKHLGLSGNYHQFLELVAQRNADEITDRDFGRLSRRRKLPAEVFKDWGIGFDGLRYTIPSQNFKGKLVDLRYYHPGKKGIRTTNRCRPCILGAEKIRTANPNKPIFLCEGEWDAMALAWWFRRAKKGGIAVGCPGADTWYPSWNKWFENRDVYICYDNDAAGSNGETKVFKHLYRVARSLHFLRYPGDAKTGEDVSDLARLWVVDKKKPKAGHRHFMDLFAPEPREGVPDDSPTEEEYESAYDHPATFQEVETAFKKWLYLKDTDGIKVALACALSNRIDGDPIWMFLVGPPGSSKTETLNGFQLSSECYATSAITSHSLISGMTFRSGMDPSLIPRLNGKLLIIKDFTAILSLRDNEKDEIFGILRDAYDGRCSKTFGNGITRSYKSSFSVLAAVTPAIYSEGRKNASLGERFIKFALADNLTHFSENAIIERAIANVSSESDMRYEIQDAVRSFLSFKHENFPHIPSRVLHRIVALAKFGARVRATVQRDRFRPDIIEGKPSAEVGSRLGKQLAKLAVSLALVDRRDTVNGKDLQLLKKTIIDTVPQRAEDIIRYLWKSCPDKDDAKSTNEVAYATKYPRATVARLLQNYNLLGVVIGIGSQRRYRWALSDYVRQCIIDSEVYSDPELIKRKRVRLKRKKKKPTKRD